MRHFLATTLLSATLLTCGSILAAQVSIGIRIGPPPPPRVVRVIPRRLGLDFFWVEGYWYPVGRHYKWHDGYWTRPPYPGARWVGPRYEGEQYFGGFWEGGQGRIEHDHHWDRDRDRDFREKHKDRGHDR
jgi:hypothetical protein